jgi:hypothetical protein
LRYVGRNARATRRRKSYIGSSLPEIASDPPGARWMAADAGRTL